MLLAGVVAPAPAVQTPVATGGKGAAPKTGEEGRGVAALPVPATGPVATAGRTALAMAPAATADQAPQTAQAPQTGQAPQAQAHAAAPAATTEVQNGLPLTPDLVGQ